MSKEFVNYEIALELKKMGFDEPCLARQDLKIEDGGYFGIDSPKSDKYLLKQGEYYTLIPLYQQAFRWFREKYNLYPTIGIATKWSFEIDYVPFSYNKPSIHSKNDYDTYEEAEIESLKQLIKIAKQKL